jgi:ATP-dependent DNA ligase
MAKAAAACHRHNAARCAAATHQPLRIGPGAEPRALVRPELVAEVKFLTCTDDNLLRQVVYEGLPENKPAHEVRRPVPHR